LTIDVLEYLAIAETLLATELLTTMAADKFLATRLAARKVFVGDAARLLVSASNRRCLSLTHGT
jgi:hypothetical protein